MSFLVIMSEEKFEDFIAGMLKRGGVKEKNIALFLTEENLAKALIAFTHSSFDPEENLETTEFFGDPVINEFVPFYIRRRWPKIRSVKWLTKIKHNLISKKYLAHLARRQGIEKHIRFGAELTTKKGKKFLMADVVKLLETKELSEISGQMSVKEYLSMLEDTVESFFGWLVEMVEDSGKSHGVAIQISHNILRSFFDNEEISIKYEDVFDAVSRLKELYESKARGYRWPNDKAYVVSQVDEDKFKVDVYGWPKGDKKVTDENRIKLATATGYDKDDVKQKAAGMALQVLDRTYHITEIPPNPYERNK